jgi:hypothetical protein
MLFASPAAGACAGYQATGRDFRFAKAVITMPTGPCGLSSPERYISLAGADSYARAGIWCSIPLGPPGPNHAASVAGRPADGATVGTYEGFFVTWQQGSVPVVHGVSLTSVSPGDGVVFSIYFTEAGDSDQFTASGSGVSASLSIDANGPVYTTAQALTDWSYSLPTTPAPASQTGRVTQFLQGRFTTASGQRGTFAGPWTLTPVEATSNGLAPPQGTLRSAPGALWTDGSSLYGLPGDAFGVWLYS